MNTELNNPTTDTWFICWNELRTEVKAYSSLTSTESMATFWTEIDYYETEVEWLTELLTQGIEPFQI